MDLLPQGALAIGGLLALLFIYHIRGVTAKRKKIKNKEAPEPAGAWPVIGHLHLLNGPLPLFRTLGSMADRYGPAFSLRLGLRPTLVVSSWELTKECFTTNDRVFATRPLIAAAKHLGFDDTLFTFSPDGPYWRQVRKIASLELLSNRRLELLKHVRASELDTCITELYGLWVANQEQPVKVEMKEWFGDLTFKLIARMVAGKRYFSSAPGCNDGEARRFRAAMTEFFYLFGGFVVSDALPFLKWFDVQGYQSAMKRVAGEIESIGRSWVAEHRRKRYSCEHNGEKDFIDALLSIMDESSDTIIIIMATVMVFGGSHMTSVTLTWALALLINHPQALKKAQEELDLLVGKNRKVDESDVTNLPYLQAIVKETLRLYPAAPLSGPREAMEDCHVGGFHVRPGTQLLVNLWKLHRDPRVWSDPLEFKPERFLDQHVDVDLRGQYFECMPFGSGQRSCPGISYALRVLHLTLARLIHSFDISSPCGEDIDMTEGLGLTMPKATPMEVVLTPRLSSELY